MLENIFSPYSDWGLVILRLATGIIFLVHGWHKLNPTSPMKGPVGFGGFLKQMGVPLPICFGWAVALLETAGAVLLILGLWGRASWRSCSPSTCWWLFSSSRCG